jgi:hypothetical protein
MSTQPTVPHILLEELTDYFAAILPEERAGVIEEHLAVCDTCIVQARQIHRLSHVIDGWTARTHGEAYQRALLVRALQHVQEHVHDWSWQKRLGQWRANLASKAGAAVRVTLEAGANVTRMITEGLEALVAPPLQPADVRSRSSIRTRGTVRTTLTPEHPQARVDVQGEHREVIVQVETLSPQRPSPLVLLIPTSPEGAPQVQALQRQTSGVHVARFTGVAPGDYLVAFEPAS